LKNLNQHQHHKRKTKLNTTNPEQIIYETNELKITIWGGIEKENLSRLKISMHIKSKANKYKSFRDDVNLYSHGNTQKLIQNISETLEVSTTAIIKTITELNRRAGSLPTGRTNSNGKSFKAETL
jgi:DNA primase